MEPEIAQSEHLQKHLKLLQYKVQAHRLAYVWRKFKEAGFDPILIKGWAAAQFYPEPGERLYVDVDLVLDAGSYERAREFASTEPLGIEVDLHREVRHLDTVPFADLYANSILKDCEDVQVRVPRDEDLLRILCVHWLTDGGADRERMWDIYYGINNRAADFEWHRLLGLVSEKRRFWIICAIGCAHKYLGLPLENTPIEQEVKSLPGWLTQAVEREWESGVRLIPLNNVRHDRQEWWRQLKKRFPPNPIQSTILMNGSFNRIPRIFYQVADIFSRAPLSLKTYIKSRLNR